MGSKTQNLGLTLTGTTQSDVYRSFKEWRQLINGENCNSNMELIDNAFGQHAQRLEALEGLTPPPS